MRSGRFAILEHQTAQGRHWDILLEWGPVLRTWSVERPPAPGLELTARQLPDHRTLYLDYAGPVSGDRGSVTRWDAGTYAAEDESARSLVVELAGGRLTGRMAISHGSEDASIWTLRIEG